MTPLVFLAIAVAGGVGAAARFAVDGLIGHRLQTAFPWATFIINVSGSLALGPAVGSGRRVLAAAGMVADPGRWIPGRLHHLQHHQL